MKNLSLAATCLLAFGIVGCQAEAPQTITVEAVGRSSTPATHAVIDLEISARRESRAEALVDIESIYQRLDDRLPQMEGLETYQVHTTSLDLRQVCPSIEGYNHRAINTGACDGAFYTASQSLELTISPAESAGNLISFANELGALEASIEDFIIPDRTELMRSASRSAVENARQSAELMAHASGMELGRIRALNPFNEYRAYFVSDPDDSIAVTGNLIMPTQTLEIAPDDVVVSQRVTVIFDLIDPERND